VPDVASPRILKLADIDPILDRGARIPVILRPPLGFESPRAEHVPIGVVVEKQHVGSVDEAAVCRVLDLDACLGQDDLVYGGEVPHAIHLETPVDLGEIAAGAPATESLDHHAVALEVRDVGDRGYVAPRVRDEVVVVGKRVICLCDSVEEILSPRCPVSEHVVGVVAALPPLRRIGIPWLAGGVGENAVELIAEGIHALDCIADEVENPFARGIGEIPVPVKLQDALIRLRRPVLEEILLGVHEFPVNNPLVAVNVRNVPFAEREMILNDDEVGIIGPYRVGEVLDEFLAADALGRHELRLFGRHLCCKLIDKHGAARSDRWKLASRNGNDILDRDIDSDCQCFVNTGHLRDRPDCRRLDRGGFAEEPCQVRVP